MTTSEFQTFLIAFGVLFAIGLAGWLWAERRARLRSRQQGEKFEPAGRAATVALIASAIMLDAALALVWVLLRRQGT